MIIQRIHALEAATLLGKIEHATQPASRLINGHFRHHTQLGGRDRRVIGDLVYQVLRHRRLLEESVEQPQPRMLVAMALCLFHGFSPDQAEAMLEVRPPEQSPDNLPLAVQHSLPDWLWELVLEGRTEQEAAQLLESLNQPAPVDLRINPLRGDRESIRQALQEEGIETTLTPWSPQGLRLVERQSVQESNPFKQGRVEIQDEGSQFISLLLDPQPGELVVDLCAGGGGKSLHLAALMADQGRLIAMDNNPGRLKKLNPRKQRAGVRIIRPQPIRNEGDKALRNLSGKAHRVLVDAPCSGTGTLRRSPDLKWRLRPDQVVTLPQQQSALLDAGARLVRVGGRLVYATCSLLQRENQAVAEAFLADHPNFQAVAPAHPLKKMGIALPESVDTRGDFLSLSPDLTGTDGFFIVIFQRRK